MLMVFLAILVGLIALLPPVLYLFGRIRDPFHPLIFIGLIVYFLVPHKMIFHPEKVLEIGLNSEIYCRYLVITGISMLGLYAGWIVAARKSARTPPPSDPAPYDPNRMILAALFFIAISLPIHFIYTINFDKDVSAYLTDLDQLWIPAAILLVQAYFHVSGNTRTGVILLLILAFVPPVERFWSYGQRSDMLRVAAILALFYMNSHKRPSKRLFITAAAALGLLVMTLSFTRTLIYEHQASNRFDAIVKVVPMYFSGYFEPVDTGAEFIFGAAQVETNLQDGHYGWGRTFTVGLIGRGAATRQYFPDNEMTWSPSTPDTDCRTSNMPPAWLSPTVPHPRVLAAGLANSRGAAPSSGLYSPTPSSASGTIASTPRTSVTPAISSHSPSPHFSPPHRTFSRLNSTSSSSWLPFS